MFTVEEFNILCRDDVKRAVDRNINRDPVLVALDSRIPEASVVATQIKRLQRAQVKLPSYYAARAILPPLAYEQSSGEICASRKMLSGYSVLDLTCGLGVDAFALSHRFEKVVTLERNEVLVKIARENFARLGAKNIEVVHASAEEFLNVCNKRFDWCFADPDRRGVKGEKLVRMEDCSPNILSLRDKISRVANKLCIKCSPMFDIAEAFRIFENCRVESVSLHGECKEVNIYVDGSTPNIAAIAIGFGEFATPYPTPVRWCTEVDDMYKYRYLVLPDVALRHSRLVSAAFYGIADVWSNNSVALSQQRPSPVIGRLFEIVDVVYFDEKNLRKRLKGKKVEIINRDFRMTNATICSKLGVREGSDERWCFTSIGGKSWAFKLESCS